MPDYVSEFLSKNLVVAALFTSAIWFYCGKQYFGSKKPTVGLAWQLIGVAILVAYCINAAWSRSWYSLIVSIAAIAVESVLIRWYWRTGRSSDGVAPPQT
jgi:hypothetical protein